MKARQLRTRMEKVECPGGPPVPGSPTWRRFRELEAMLEQDRAGPPDLDDIAALLRAGQPLTVEQAQYVADLIEGKVSRPRHRPAASKADMFARDLAIAVKYSSARKRGLSAAQALIAVKKEFHLGAKSIEAALGRARKFWR